MKINAEILAVETAGDTLKLKLQGRGEVDADWRPYLSLAIELPDTERTRRTYHVGRVVTFDIGTR